MYNTLMAIPKKAKGKKAKTKGQLVKQLDDVYSKYIREKYLVGGLVYCVSCGKPGELKNMQNGHYVSRGRHSTRWLDKNCHPQCYACNVAMKGNYVRYTKYMIDTYGPGVIDELLELSAADANFSRADIMDMIEDTKRKLEELQALHNNGSCAIIQ